MNALGVIEVSKKKKGNMSIRQLVITETNNLSLGAVSEGEFLGHLSWCCFWSIVTRLLKNLAVLFFIT